MEWKYHYIVEIKISSKEDIDTARLLDAAHESGSFFEGLLGVDIRVDDEITSAGPFKPEGFK